MMRKAARVGATSGQPVRSPAGMRPMSAVGQLDTPALIGRETRDPGVVRVPVSWWDSPLAVCCSLSHGPRSARAARQVTRNTLCDWGWNSLIEDAEIIVAELVANAVTHAATPAMEGETAVQDPSLRLLRGTTGLLCAVLDPSEKAPRLSPVGPDESGRGLRIVDRLSDAWGWSPIPGRGKGVWAILSHTSPSGSTAGG